jgi:hypothetical protein
LVEVVKSKSRVRDARSNGEYEHTSNQSKLLPKSIEIDKFDMKSSPQELGLNHLNMQTNKT